MTTCRNCGQPNADVTRICRYCGTSLLTGERPTATETGVRQPPSFLWDANLPPAAVEPYVSPTVANQATVAAGGYRCPHCQTTELPVLGQRISTAGWIVFFSLLIFCFPLCFIGLFIKEDYRICGWCRGAVS